MNARGYRACMEAADTKARYEVVSKRLGLLMDRQDHGQLTDDEAFELQRLSDEFELLTDRLHSERSAAASVIVEIRHISVGVK
jgi:hypothetical protein